MYSRIAAFAFMVGILVFCMALINNNPIKILYDFKAKTIDGKDFDFSSLKGKKVLIVPIQNSKLLCLYNIMIAKFFNDIC